MNKKANAERKRLERLLEDAKVSEHHRAALQGVLDNVALMRIKLDEAGAELEGASIICEYDNGGGQKGTRENPLFKAYESLWKSYMNGVEKICSYLPKEIQEEETNQAITLLEAMRLRKASNG